MHRWLHRLLNSLLVALLLTAIWAGWYVSHRGFGQKWRKKVAEEFARRGVFLTVRRLTLDPLRGLAAQDVKIFRDGPSKKQVARIHQLNLDISYTRLLQKLSFINAIEIHDGAADLPLDPADPNGRVLRLENLQAKLYFPSDRLEVRRLEGEIAGLHFDLSGTLLHPDAFRLSPKEKSVMARRDEHKSRILEELSAVALDGPARLEVRFSGDLVEPESLRIDKALFSAERVAWKGNTATDLVAEGRFAEGRAILQQLRWQDAVGETLLAGSLEKDGGFFLQIQAGTDWLALARALQPDPLLSELVLRDRRKIRGELSFSPTRAPGWLLLGSVEIGEFSFKGVEFDALTASFSSDGTRWMLHDLKVRQESGMVQGEFLGQAEKFNARLISNLNPLPLLPALMTSLPAELRDLRFFSPPHADLQISGQGTDPATWTTTGHLTLGRTSFRGYGLNSARADLRLVGSLAEFENVQLERDEGSAEGSFSFNAATQEVRLKDVLGNVDPVAVCTWISPKLGRTVAPYRFRVPPEVRGAGLVVLKRPTGTDLSLQISAPRGMDYLFIKKDLPFDSVRGDLAIKDRLLTIRNMEGAIFEGNVVGEVDVSIQPGDQSYRTAFQVEGVSFPKLTGLYFDYQGSSGLLTGSAEFRGTGLDPRLLIGNGKIAVKDGEVFEIPIFGPFSKTLDHLMPGIGYSRARKASGTFKMEDGLITTKDFQITGQGVSMFGEGQLAFLDNSMNFDMRINTNGWTGVVLDPVSRFFEFHSDGPLNKPLWRARKFSTAPAPLSKERSSPVAIP